MTAGQQPSLTIVIPALNEERAIGAIVERCLAARERIVEKGRVRHVDVVVVSDGSSDRTAAIAKGYAEIALVEFPRNRGYGAAIKTGWETRPNDLLGFIDADGTCDPEHFAVLCAALQDADADIVLGSRMGPESRMPWIRRLGNRIYAVLLRALSQRDVADTASGMRVVRRAALPQLLPLPDGLHFTPAMSARALLENLRIVECPMSYEERIGRSKLHVLRDGLRFLQIILATTLFVRPSRLLLPIIALLLACAGILVARPALGYLTQRSVEEWLIYRVLLAGLLVSISVLLLTATSAAEQLIAVARGAHRTLAEEGREWWTRIEDRLLLGAGLLLVALGVGLVWPALESYVSTGTVTMHWSRVVVAMFCELLAAQLLVAVLLNRVIVGVVRQQTERRPQL